MTCETRPFHASSSHEVPYTCRWNWVRDLLAERGAKTRKLTASDKIAGVAIAQYVNKQSGDAWPSQATLARDTALSPRQIRRSLSKLKEGGWLVQTRGGGGVGQLPDGLTRGFTNVFRLGIPPQLVGTGHWKKHKTNPVKLPIHRDDFTGIWPIAVTKRSAESYNS